jgi:hypothetical protein
MKRSSKVGNPGQESLSRIGSTDFFYRVLSFIDYTGPSGLGLYHDRMPLNVELHPTLWYIASRYSGQAFQG